MKKNKAIPNENETASGLGIPQEALANLADKLKIDLAKSTQSQPPSKTSPDKKRSKKQAKPKSQQTTQTNGSRELKDNGSGVEPKKSRKSKDDRPNTEKAHSHREISDQLPKDAKPSRTSAELPRTKNNKSSKLKTARPADNAQEQPSAEPSLLQEILALGGTKEDLELVNEIDSEEEIFESQDSQKARVRGGKGKTDEKTLRKELQDQLKQLGLGGRFPDEDDDESMEEWTDEEVEPVTSVKAKETVTRPTKETANVEQKVKNRPSEIATQQSTIDRPLQLSNTSKPEQKAANQQKVGKLKLEPHSLWYEIERPDAADKLTTPNTEIVAHLQSRGNFLLQAESEAYMSSNHVASSDRQFLSTIMTSGTQTDKLSALTLSITSSPIHSRKQLEALLGMAKKKSRNEAVQAIAALKDLLVGNLLPDGKLVFFGKQPGIHSAAKDEELMLWAFEDWLKGWYFQVLQVVEGLLMDQLPFVRNHMISYIFELLRDKPEQEQLLLRLLVNKLGDGNKKIAAKTSYYLLQLESAHPQMKSIILHEMENLLFRPNTSVHAQYYTIITMNQTILTSRDTSVANRLVEVYFILFVKLLRGGVHEGAKQPVAKAGKKVKGKGKKKRGAVDWEELNQQEGEVNSKILSAVLTGVNRAFPFSNVENDIFEKHMDILFMITHDANFNAAVQALTLIHQVATTKQIVLDRYYRTLYESLLDRRLTNSSKQALYLNLLFKSLKSDTNFPRVKAFIKRIVQTTSLHNPGFICGVLFLLAELTNSRPNLKSLWSSSTDTSDYDSRKRDPLFAQAEESSLWELSPLLSHYHPTVQLYAENLLNTKPNTAKPDLALHSIKHFLDRFVYRNPKTKSAPRGSSIMQPLPGTDASLVLGIRGHAKTEVAVNSEDWWRQQIDRIKPDEIFFHKYFVAKEEGEVKALGKKRKREAEDTEMDEDEIWEALVKSSKEEGGLGDVDVDVDGEDDEDIEWSDEELDDDLLAEMNEGDSDMEEMSDMDQDVDDEMSGEEGDVNEFFDDEAEEAEDEDVEDSEGEPEDNDASDEEEDVSDDAAMSDDLGGDFDFDEDADDMMDSDEDVPVPALQSNFDGSKKRKLKNLPIFASVEEYADMLD